MRPIELITGRKGLTFGTGSGTFTQPPFWVGESTRDAEEFDGSFAGYVSGAYKSNGVIFACILARMLVFSEARFQYQRITAGRPGDLFGDPSLSLLERPWPNGTTGELLSKMEQDVSLAGNCYLTVVEDRHGRRIRRMRPDHVTIVTGSESGDPWALDARVVGYLYKPTPGADPVLLTTDKVAHWSPIPDPDAQWRGMSWITPVINEVKADNSATKHKQKFFDNGTVGSVVVTYEPTVSQQNVEKFAAMWKDAHQGTQNAYKTFHLGGGADAKTLGADLKQLDFKVTQGAGETRIAAASGVGAVIAQLSEGLQGSSLNAGNFSAAKRRFADGTIRPNWRSASAALETLVAPPDGARLWYDARDVPFLQEDQKDEAEILAKDASTISTLISAGFKPDAVIAAVAAGDLRTLTGSHTGLYSVQLREPGDTARAPARERLTHSTEGASMTTEHKALTRVEIKDADKGEVAVVFATLDVIDSDGDVTVKGAFETGAPVRISAYGHKSWEGVLPVGKGKIREVGKEAVMDGQFFMDTTAGRDTFTVVKELGEDGLQEWSYGYDPEQYEFGKFNDTDVRFLKKLKVHEVSPVLLGAGVGTRLLTAKSIKFDQHADSVLAEISALVDRFPEVITFRTGQGKSRLSEHSVELLDRVEAEMKRLVALRDPAPNDTTAADDVEAEWLRFVALNSQGA